MAQAPTDGDENPRKGEPTESELKTDEAVGDRIAKAREFLGLTQATVAERMALARTTQVAIEQGRRPVSVAELYRYAEILSRPLDYLSLIHI